MVKDVVKEAKPASKGLLNTEGIFKMEGETIVSCQKSRISLHKLFKGETLV